MNQKERIKNLKLKLKKQKEQRALDKEEAELKSKLEEGSIGDIIRKGVKVIWKKL